MTVLAADIGNSHTVIGILQQGEVAADWRVSTDERRTSDEWAVLVRGLVAGALDEADLTGIAVCSTVPAVLHEWREMLTAHFADVPAVVVEPGIRTGVPVLMDNPREVARPHHQRARRGTPLRGAHGGGRLRHRHHVRRGQRPGEYIGGAIAPGLEISLEALGRRGAQLRKVEILRPRNVIAKNTVEALQSGMLYGYSSMVDGLTTRMLAELGEPSGSVNVVATGHMAPIVLDECGTLTSFAPHLTLIGLEIVFHRNAPA